MHACTHHQQTRVKWQTAGQGVQCDDAGRPHAAQMGSLRYAYGLRMQMQAAQARAITISLRARPAQRSM
jgi:hypothetical protein